MPCYDERGSGRTEYVRVTPKEYRHNSPVAQMLCTILKRHPELARINNDIRQWWKEHKERDKKEGK